MLFLCVPAFLLSAPCVKPVSPRFCFCLAEGHSGRWRVKLHYTFAYNVQSWICILWVMVSAFFLISAFGKNVPESANIQNVLFKKKMMMCFYALEGEYELVMHGNTPQANYICTSQPLSLRSFVCAKSAAMFHWCQFTEILLLLIKKGVLSSLDVFFMSSILLYRCFILVSDIQIQDIILES